MTWGRHGWVPRGPWGGAAGAGAPARLGLSVARLGPSVARFRPFRGGFSMSWVWTGPVIITDILGPVPKPVCAVLGPLSARSWTVFARFGPFPRDFGLDRLGHYFPDVVRPFLRIVCCIYGPFGFEASVPFVPWANSCFSARTPRRSHGFAPEAHLRRASRGGDLASSMPSRRAPRLSKRSATVTRGESLTLRDESVRSRGWDGLGEPMFSSPDASPCDLAKFKLSRGLGLGGGAPWANPCFPGPDARGELVFLPQDHT